MSILVKIFFEKKLTKFFKPLRHFLRTEFKAWLVLKIKAPLRMIWIHRINFVDFDFDWQLLEYGQQAQHKALSRHQPLVRLTNIQKESTHTNKNYISLNISLIAIAIYHTTSRWPTVSIYYLVKPQPRVCWSLTSLCHSNGHIKTMPAREINPFTVLTRIRSQFLRTQWSTSNHQRVDTTTPQTAQPSGLAPQSREHIVSKGKFFNIQKLKRKSNNIHVPSISKSIQHTPITWCTYLHSFLVTVQKQNMTKGRTDRHTDIVQYLPSQAFGTVGDNNQA